MWSIQKQAMGLGFQVRPIQIWKITKLPKRQHSHFGWIKESLLLYNEKLAQSQTQQRARKRFSRLKRLGRLIFYDFSELILRLILGIKIRSEKISPSRDESLRPKTFQPAAPRLTRLLQENINFFWRLTKKDEYTIQNQKIIAYDKVWETLMTLTDAF